ncbi:MULTISPECIES: hypothetical protein [Paenibacillus]|uniref:hypothetical protein n=1 Tax=Paenibacillus TaxID=44249 RepID=UPI00096D1763|nr:hypothetical protein [Paenibacillus odorifer]OME06740.1 hypothetical protein BSK60_32160 [Paenibacillus odorifer]
MSKLTEIKERVESFNTDPNLYGVVMTVDEMNHLLSLLEEKDKALQEIWQTEDFLSGSTADAMRRRAYAALTSSNNEGDTI